MTVLGFDVFWRDHGATRGMKNLGDDTHKTTQKFSKFGTVAAGAGIIVGAAIFKLGKDSVKAYTDAQSSQQKLQDAFARFPKLADVSIGSLRALNVELHNKTRFDDDAFASGQAVLAQFGLTGKQLTEITPLLADYAAKTGKDLPTAAQTLGKAFLGNTRALKAIGIDYKLTGDKAKDMANITQLVRDKVGGFAEKEGKTGAGQAEILRNRFGDLEEVIGQKLLPALLKIAGVLLSTIGFISRNAKVIGPLVVIFGTFVGTLFTAVKVIGLVNAGLALMGVETTIATGGLTLLIPAIAAIVAGLILLYKKSDAFQRIVKGTFNWIRQNWPLLLGILTGPIGLATILIIKNWTRIKETFRTVFLFVANLFFDVIKAIIHNVGTLVGVFAKLPGPLGKPFKKAKEAIRGAEDSVKDLQDRINRTHGKKVVVSVEMQMKNRLKIAAQQGVSLTVSGKPIALATGGWIRGEGGPTSDMVPAMLSNGEYVVKAAAAKKLGARFLDLLNRADSVGGDPAGMVLKFAAGGSVAQAQAFVRNQANDPYVWGGVGPNGFDCSGLTGAVYGLLRGLGPYQRFFTTASDFSRLGFRPGTGAYTIGVNPYTHMAGNIGGLPFEAASTRSGIHVGAGAQSVMNFARRYYLAALGGVFGGMGSVNLGPPELRQLMRGISLRWGIHTGGPATSFDRGTPFVPATGLYGLHRGEAVIPAKYNRPGGGTVVNVTVNTGGVVGMTKMDLENALVATLQRVAGQGRLDTAVRLASR